MTRMGCFPENNYFPKIAQELSIKILLKSFPFHFKINISFWNNFRLSEKLQIQYRQFPFALHPINILQNHGACQDWEINIDSLPLTKLQTLFRFHQFSTNARLLFQDPAQDTTLHFEFRYIYHIIWYLLCEMSSFRRQIPCLSWCRPLPSSWEVHAIC